MEHSVYVVDATALALRLPFRFFPASLLVKNGSFLAEDLHDAFFSCWNVQTCTVASCSPSEGRGHKLYYGNNARKKHAGFLGDVRWHTVRGWEGAPRAAAPRFKDPRPNVQQAAMLTTPIRTRTRLRTAF